MSINQIHINSSTKMTLNDRFTVMQSIGPRGPPRTRTQSLSRQNAAKSSSANRKLLEQLDKKHKIQTALKLKRRSLKTNMTTRPRMRNRMGRKKGSANAIRLGSNGKLTRSNSLSNIATMKADLVQPTLKRSNSTSSLAGRLGSRHAGAGRREQPPRGRLNRSNMTRRVNTRQNITRSRPRSRSRSNSVSNLKRSSSNTNLRRRNSRTNLNNGPRALTSNRQNRENYRSASRSHRPGRPGNSVSNRLGVRKTVISRGRPRNVYTQRRPPNLGGVAQGRVTKRRNSIGSLANNNARSGAKGGRISRPRGRGNARFQRTRSQSRSKNTNSRSLSQSSQGRRGSRSGRGRGGSRGRGINRPLAQRPDIKKEDLDKELDQYMANTKTGNDQYYNY